MKKVLIITPFFPPINAADMHRVRQSISYYKENGWDAEVVTVEASYINMIKDDLLLNTIPTDIKIHKVKAFDEKFTRKFGLGSIAYRSMYYYWKYVNRLLSNTKYDLIFFSTTAFPITILGRFWKNKFKVPYVIDMQDPWRSDHYLKLPKSQRPSKFWISYLLDTCLEWYTMKRVDGLISVSESYIEILMNRYENVKNIPTSVIPFAAYPIDIEVSMENGIENKFFNTNNHYFNIVYVGRAGHDMAQANTIFLKAIKAGLNKNSNFERIRIYYVGTSYDQSINAKKTVMPIADELNLNAYVVEQTQRIPYFESLKILSEASLLFVPGSDNIGYTASKIYSYVWFKKPLLTLFHSSSSVNNFIENCNAGLALKFDKDDEQFNINAIITYIEMAFIGHKIPEVNWDNFKIYTSEFQAKRQIELFNNVIKNAATKNN